MPTAMDNTPTAPPVTQNYHSSPAGTGGVVDPTGSLSDVLSTLGTNPNAIVWDDTPSMEVAEDSAAAVLAESDAKAAQDAALAGAKMLDGGAPKPPGWTPTQAAAPAEPAPVAAPPPPSPATEPAPLPTAEERKAYLQATSKAARAEREAAQKLARAQASERKAAELAAQAQAFQAATAEWQKDPTAIIRAAGLSEQEYFQRLAEHALASADQPPPDPIAIEVEKRIAPILKAQQEAAEAAQRHQQALAETRGIMDKVLPVIQQGGEKYETLVALHGGDANKAAVYVYQKMKERFDHDGTFIEPAAAAEELEEYHYQQQLEGLKAAKALKKFQGEFGVPAPVAAAHAPVAPPPPPAPKPPPSPTLTAASGPKVTPMAPVRSGNKIIAQRNTARTGDKDLDEVMGKFGLR